MFIIGLGTANPPNQYSQRQCWETLRPSKAFAKLRPRSKKILEKVLCGDNGIDTRFLALDRLEDAFQLNPDTLHKRFSKTAPQIAESAALDALADAGVSAEEIDAIIVSTCTGFLCPGLTSYVAERLKLRPEVLTLDLVGQGCGAAIPNLRNAAALVHSGVYEKVLSICVEVSSAAFYLDDDPGVLISACLFGDGAAAAVVSRGPVFGKVNVQWKAAHSLLSPEDRDYLRFDHRCGMLRNILSLRVPALAAKHVETVFSDLLNKSGCSPENVDAWILHAGGRNVLQALQKRLQLTNEQVRTSSDILQKYGNMSSPFVLFVLKAALEKNDASGNWFMSSFGAGFSCHGAMLRVGD